MKTLLSFFLLAIYANIFAQKISLDTKNLLPNQVYMSAEKLDGKAVVRVIKDSTLQAVDEPTFVKIKDADFEDDIIKVMFFRQI